MSKDRLEKALEAMKSEHASPEQLAGAKARVWNKLGESLPAACTEFRPSLRDYLAGLLTGNRRLLMEDHLSRCPQCRAQLAGLKGAEKVVEKPSRAASWWPRWRAWAAIAVLVVAGLYAGRDRIDGWMAPGGPRATVTSLTGGLYRVPEGAAQTGASIGEGEVIRTGPGAHALLRLADGSTVDVNERTELFVRAAWSGQVIHLRRGDIVVQAAKQHRGHLRVQTRDSAASVKGTVFAVSAGLGGTVVSVIAGSVAVAQHDKEVLLGPGQQAASSPALASSVRTAVSWSPEADAYMALLASVVKLERQIADLPHPALRTESRLLQYLPPNTMIYGAIPNLGGTINQAMALVKQQSVENAAFQKWWDSGAGQELKELVGRMEKLAPTLGDEIVFNISTSQPDNKDEIPIVIAEVKPGKQAELASALDSLAPQSGGTPFAFSLNDKLVVASDSQTHLQWVLGHLGQGAGTAFGTAITERYQRGVGWLLGLEMESFSNSAGSSETAFTGMQQMKHLFVEQRAVTGAEENEVTLTFKGPRMGMASWLASTGSGGAAEYLPADSLFAVYASTREPRQLFDELTAQLAKSAPSIGEGFAQAEAKLGISIADDLAGALGTESALSLDGFSVTGPVWVMAALVNNTGVLDNTVRKLVDAYNAELAPQDQGKRISLTQETVDGRIWTTMRAGTAPLSITWTYDGGYLVAGSDRGSATRAIGTRNGGSPLVWSPAFLQQLPSSAGLHPSGFAWLNTKGALQGFASLVPNRAIQQLMTETEPILVVFNGSTEQIHAASRTRVSGLVLNVMMLESLSRMNTGTQGAVFRQKDTQTGKR